MKVVCLNDRAKDDFKAIYFSFATNLLFIRCKALRHSVGKKPTEVHDETVLFLVSISISVKNFCSGAFADCRVNHADCSTAEKQAVNFINVCNTDFISVNVQGDAIVVAIIVKDSFNEGFSGGNSGDKSTAGNFKDTD